MIKNILIFRTDRIGDLLYTCPTIKTIKTTFPDSKLTIIASENNYKYAKTFEFIDEIYLMPKKSLWSRIKLFYKLYKKKYDLIYIFDGKDRSLIFTSFLKSDKKVAKIVNKKQAIFSKIFKIKFSYDIFGKDLNELHQDLLLYSGINQKITHFDYLTKKKDNNFLNSIPLDSFIQVHLDEKWFSSSYIKKYADISPSYEEFSNFIKLLSSKNNVLISTGLISNNLINRLEQNSKKQLFDKIFLYDIKENIILVKNPSFLDLESILRKTKTLISCHGALTHAAASFKINIIDIVEKSRDELVKRYSLYIKNYYKLYRKSFKYIIQDINEIL